MKHRHHSRGSDMKSLKEIAERNLKHSSFNHILTLMTMLDKEKPMGKK